MKPFLKELFEYNYNFNKKTLEVLVEKPEHVSDKLIGLLSHTSNAHGIWNSRIQSQETKSKPWDIQTIEQLIKKEPEHFNVSMSIIDRFDLDNQIQYVTGSGKTFTNSVRDILFHIINHSTYHRGQIATELRQCNIEPLMTDWILYKII